METKLIYKEENKRIMGTCFEVYKKIGCGFLESVYQECLEIELYRQGILSDPQKEISLVYKGGKLGSYFIPAFVCFDKIIIEIKAVSKLVDEHRSQVLNYLNAIKYKLGLLANFDIIQRLNMGRFGI